MKDQTKPHLQCLIIDDETHAHQALKLHIEKVPYLNFVGSCTNGLDALIEISRLNPDIILLDVDMPNLSGLALIETITNIASKVILTTAHGEFAVQGFNLQVADFLLKPISFERFLRAIEKVRLNLQFSGNMNLGKVSTGPGRSNHSFSSTANQLHCDDKPDGLNEAIRYGDKSIWITVNKKVIQIDYKDISFIQSEGNYVKFFAKHQTFVTRLTLTRLSRNLPSTFVQTSRSYIVNRNAVKAIEGNLLIMDVLDYNVPIPAESRTEIFIKLTERFG